MTEEKNGEIFKAIMKQTEMKTTKPWLCYYSWIELNFYSFVMQQLSCQQSHMHSYLYAVCKTFK